MKGMPQIAWRRRYGISIGYGRIMERGQALAAPGEAQAAGRPSSGVGPAVSHGDYFPAPNRSALATHSAGIGLRQRRDLLASAARLDKGWRVASTSGKDGGDLGPTGQGRCLARGDGQRQLQGAFWGDHTGPNPTDRAKKGCKRHVLSDAHGSPLVVQTTPANVNDGTKAIDLLDAMPVVPGPRGRPRQRPDVALGDRAYGTAANREACRERGILPLLAQPRTENGSGLGTLRYVIERTMAWFGNFRRLRLCYEKTSEHLQALHELAATLICAKKLGWT